MKFTHHTEVKAPILLVDLLSEETGLSKSIVKDCLKKGAVWLRRPKRKEIRVRRAKYQLKKKDSVKLYYDTSILSQPAPEPVCISDEGRYSIWNKPAGLLSQGTKYGDHCSLLRLVEKHFENRDVFLVHRLDREASGLILIAHDRQAAAAFSTIFGHHKDKSVEKWYQATVQKVLGENGKELRIELPLDGKSSTTIVKVIAIDQQRDRSDLLIQILTGRYHQIRRHLSMIGHPIIGDHRYGRPEGEKLHLKACRLSFTCPLTGQAKSYTLQ
ncbi:RluA family pseudouridine synthase [Desulfosediminicola sp.]|uniref:RluA family pseudouridine synthase n=1 Tax=Desulfosediminicola sp. TaxID=2886825 RepID=UPI003AF24A1A